jgi:hypothetical protein
MNTEEQVNQSIINNLQPENLTGSLNDMDSIFNGPKAIETNPNITEVLSAVATRSKLLSASDWMVMPDSSLSEEDLSAIKQFRQVLRDLPESDGWKEKGSVNFLRMPEIPEFKHKSILKAQLNETVEVVELTGEDFLDPDSHKIVRLEDSFEIDMSPGLETLKPDLENIQPVPEEYLMLGGKPPAGNPLLSAESEPKRARNESGKFVKDDPSTPDYNEAWEGGKAPKAESDPESPEG